MRAVKSRGFSLLEVLIAVLVLSIGLLGLAGLQVLSIKQNHNSYLRSQATFLAHDVIERMRANRTAAVGGAYDIGFGESAGSGGSVAESDLASWKARLARELPSGDGDVAVSGELATVTIRWDDARGDTGGDNQGGELLTFRVTTGL